MLKNFIPYTAMMFDCLFTTREQQKWSTLYTKIISLTARWLKMLVEVQPSPLFFVFISQQARRDHYTQRAIIPIIRQCQNRVCSQPGQVQWFANSMLSKEDSYSQLFVGIINQIFKSNT